MEINNILLETLTKKESSIIDFWKTKQKEIGISKLEFWVQLNKSIDFYYNEIEKKSKKKNLPTSESLKKLEQPLLKWADEIKAIIYYYNYNRSNVISINSSVWKHYEVLKNFNIVSFSSELKNKPAEQIPEYLDFHLRNFKRQYEKFSNWNELLAQWFSHTKKQMPAIFTPQQKDQFLTWFENQNEIKITAVKPAIKENSPASFEDIFNNKEFIQNCIDVLKEVEPPLIDANYTFIGKRKGAVCVWIDELQRQGFVKHYTDRKVFSKLIPQKIKRFSIDESMFGKPHKMANDDYRKDFKTLISQIKLSQPSQKGKLGK